LVNGGVGVDQALDPLPELRIGAVRVQVSAALVGWQIDYRVE
jgi:hypothetical protein